jgi:hypothetical protein
VSVAGRDPRPFVITHGQVTEIPLGWLSVLIALIAAAFLGLGVLATLTSWLAKVRAATEPDERRRFGALALLGMWAFAILAAVVFMTP